MAKWFVVGHADEAGLRRDEQAEVIAEGKLAALGGRTGTRQRNRF